MIRGTVDELVSGLLPKFPPPRHSAQKRSWCCVFLAVTTLPSARTKSAESRLSMVNPCARARYPRPPPSIGPAPVVDTATGGRNTVRVRQVVEFDPGGATTYACASSCWVDMNMTNRTQIDNETSLRDAETRCTVTDTTNGQLESASASSGRLAMTSATCSALTIASGCLSIIPLCTARAPSYSKSSRNNSCWNSGTCQFPLRPPDLLCRTLAARNWLR